MNTCIIWNNSRYNDKWETVHLCFYCAHCESKLHDSVKFQLEIFSLFFILSLSLIVLKLFLIFGQSQPYYSYKVVLIKKSVYIGNDVMKKLRF